MSELLTIDKAEFQRMLNQAVIAGMLAMEGKKSIVRTEYTITETMGILNVGKSKIYDLINSGQLETKKRFATNSKSDKPRPSTFITLKSIRNYQNR